LQRASVGFDSLEQPEQRAALFEIQIDSTMLATARTVEAIGEEHQRVRSLMWPLQPKPQSPFKNVACTTRARVGDYLA
jgi:hypothetical protein